MPERVLFVTNWQFSPRACELIPAIRTALDDLRLDYEVEVFRWPTVKPLGDMPPTWEAAVEALRARITPDCHVVSGGSSAAMALMALSPKTTAASFVTSGMLAPPATLRALGMSTLATAVDFLNRASHGPQGGYQTMQSVMAEAPDTEIRNLATLVDEDIDWDYARAFADSFSELNLVAQGPLVQLPTLCLEASIRLSGWTEMRRVFLLFVPDAEGGELRLWPGRMHDPAAGREFASKARAFLARVPVAAS